MEREGIAEQVDALFASSDLLAHAILSRIVELVLEPPTQTPV